MASPPPAQDASQDPSVRGLTGGQALNLSLNYSADAFRASAIVNQALLGIQPHDLTNVVAGNEEVFKALAASGNQLSSFVHTFNATMAALAARQQQLSQTISLLPPFLQPYAELGHGAGRVLRSHQGVRAGADPGTRASSTPRSAPGCRGWPSRRC